MFRQYPRLLLKVALSFVNRFYMGQTLNIAVSGCGISGLAAACLLRDQGHKVTIFDEYAEPRAVGSGLIIHPPAQDVLRQIGIFAEAMAYGAKVTEYEGAEADGTTPTLAARLDILDPGDFGLAIHRGALFDLLLKAAKARNVVIEPNCLVLDTVGIEGVYLRIEGSRQAGPFDLVVDAAGSGSGLSPLDATPSKHGVLWTTVDLPEGADLGGVFRMRSRDARQMAGVLPVGLIPGDPHPKAAIFWNMRRDEFRKFRDEDIEEWKAEAVALWPDLEYFIRGITDHEALTYAPFAQGSLMRMHRDKIAFVGDAAHQSAPYLGQGGNHALLDAAVLANALETNKTVPAALRSYSLRRIAHVKFYQAISRFATPLYQSRYRFPALLRNRMLAPLMGKGFVARAMTRMLSCRTMRPATFAGANRRNAEEAMPLHGPGE